MKYLNFTFRGKPEMLAILSVFLFEDGFEGIEEQGMQMQAYISDTPENQTLSPVAKEFIQQQKIEYSYKNVADTNWNEAWEKSFEPIQVGNRCIIRAAHHPAISGFEYDILIEPKMTFGTGHHPTTYLMVKKMLSLAWNHKTVFDFGTGTGVLAILAEKMAAEKIFAIDIDPNCLENTAENIALNQCTKVVFGQGDIELINGQKYDVVLANVTRNVLLEKWQQLFDALKHQGHLLISGFYQEDKPYFEKAAKQTGLSIVDCEEKDNWLVIVLKK